MKATVKNHGASKDMRNNWSKRTLIHFDSYEFSIYTSKDFSNCLVTRASCGKINGNLVSHLYLSDFSKYLANTSYPRITSAIVEKQHSLHVIGKPLGDLINEVTDFYKLPRVTQIEFA